MNCEEYLLRYRKALEAVDELEGQIEEEELRQSRLAARYDSNKVDGSGEPNAKLDPLGDLVLRKKRAEEAAEEKRREVRRFIATVGSDSEKDRRSRQLLRLYYAEGYTWKEVQKLLKPLKTRTDGRQAARRKGCISEPTLFRERNEAMIKAESAYRRMNKYAR